MPDATRDPFRRGVVPIPRTLAIAANVAALIGLAVVVAAERVPAHVLGFFAIGSGIGIATCIPIGVANVIVIDSACRHGGRRAIGAGVGGALADGVYASLGIFGVGPLLAQHPALPYVLEAISGVVLISYGIVLVRARQTIVATGPAPRLPDGGHLIRGVAIGLAATLLNPSALVTWVVIVGSHASRVTSVEGAAWVTGIVLGTFAWFLVVAALALRGRRALRGNAGWMTRVVGVLVIGSGVAALVRMAFGAA